MVAVADGEQIYTSTDSGATWTPQESGRNWNSVVSSADGTRLAATASASQIYVRSNVTSTPGAAGGIAGGNTDSLELIYLGAGKFLIMSQKGSIVAY